MTFWTLILQGFLISPLHTLTYIYGPLQRCRSDSLTWDIGGSMSFYSLLVGQWGYAVIHRDSDSVLTVCLCELSVRTPCARTALSPKSVSLLTFSGRCMTEWSSRSSLHLPQRLSVVTFHQTLSNPGRPDPPQPMFIQETGGLVKPGDRVSGLKKKGNFIQGAWILLVIARVGEKLVCIAKWGKGWSTY